MSEMSRLSAAQQAAVKRVIEKCRKSNSMESESLGGIEEAYAYIGSCGQINWGFNGPPKGFCIARGQVKL